MDKQEDAPMVSPYLAYLIRLWRVETAEGSVWRVVLEDPYSTERRGFADLPALYRFLDERTDSVQVLTAPAPDIPIESQDNSGSQ
jgi:hypothetical protein